MIPYDDLVTALNAWRARQGLPVSTMGTAGSGPTTGSPGSGPTPVAQSMTGSGPTPGSGPRTAPPMAPPARAKAASIPPPLAHADELEVDDSAMLVDEAAYENEGDDFAMSFGQTPGGGTDDATSIGGAPERPTDPADPRNRDDW